MRTLVTGATGLVGHAVARQLVDRGHSVRALVRSVSRARAVLPEEVALIHGDVTEPSSLEPAMRTIEWVFHCAGLPEQWQRDPKQFDRVNREGTANVLAAALAAGVRRTIYTSTMDVFEAPRGGTVVESRVDAAPKATAYERSKQAAELEADRIRARGLDVVCVNPGAVYGPGPAHVSLNGFFIQLLNGKSPLVPPGGLSLAFIDGVARAHLAAAAVGRSGERYLIVDEHLSMAELASRILRAVGRDRTPPNAPEWLMRTLATSFAALGKVFDFQPPIAPGLLSYLLWDARGDASKARRELGFEATPVELGITQTISSLRRQGLVSPSSGAFP
jgi:dihydroflavonol-4-reductase